ncbi:MAG TPA: alpha-glucuronidase family glycosyl hydrolase, partial [Hanamia sp.]
MQRFFLTIAMMATMFSLHAENGYRLWLRYDKIDNGKLLTEYQQQITGIQFNNTSATLQIAQKELLKGLHGLLAK